MNYKILSLAIFCVGFTLSPLVVECVTDESATAEDLITDETKAGTVSESAWTAEETSEEVTTGQEEVTTEEEQELTTEGEQKVTKESEEEATTEKVEEVTTEEEQEVTTEGEQEVTKESEEETTTEKVEEVTTEGQEESTEKQVEITTPTDDVEELNGKCECLAGISGSILIGSGLKEIHLNDEQLTVKCNSNAAESCKKLCLAKIRKGNKGLKLKRKTGNVVCTLLKLSFKRKVEIWSKITCDSPKYSFAVTTTTNTGYSFKGKLSCKDGHLAIKSSEETDETNETDETDETDEDDD